jgi:O-acetyl-ADP-ribose deacetylase (regulator of RNase III)
MKIYLLDQSEAMADAWKEAFGDTTEIEIVQNDFHHFMETHEPEVIVNAGNSFGEMTGGIDLAISEFFGWGLQKRVQAKIEKECFGEQPVGSVLVIENIDGIDTKLYHVPSMRLPQIIVEPLTIYQCTRVALMTAIKEKAGSIVLPAFGGGCGEVPPSIIAKQMKDAIEQLLPYLENGRPSDSSFRSRHRD